MTLDDGERPLLALLEHLDGRRPAEQLVRTYRRRIEANHAIVELVNHAEQMYRLPKWARQHGMDYRSGRIFPLWICSTRCTGSGPTVAGTS